MSDAEVTSLMARCLTKPRTTRRLLANAAKRSPVPTRRASSRVDIQKLALFAGFITKVRHSELFEHAPGTLALLRAHELELSVFRDYFLTGGGEARPSKTVKIAKAFAHFMQFSGSARGRRVPGLRDVIAFERAQWELRIELQSWRPTTSPVRTQVEARSVVELTGPVRLLRVVRSPWLISEAIGRGDLKLKSVPISSAWLLLQARSDARQIDTTNVDAALAQVVNRIDGRRRLRDIRSSLGNRPSWAAMASMVELLLEAGVVQQGKRRHRESRPRR